MFLWSLLITVLVICKYKLKKLKPFLNNEDICTSKIFLSKTWSLGLSGVVVSDTPSTFSIIRLNVNTVERMFLLSQGIYLDYIWTLFFRKKRSMIWSLVTRLLGKDLTKSSGSFSVFNLENNEQRTYFLVQHSKTQVFFKNPYE